jgi:hypothetical protein
MTERKMSVGFQASPAGLRRHFVYQAQSHGSPGLEIFDRAIPLGVSATYS